MTVRNTVTIWFLNVFNFLKYDLLLAIVITYSLIYDILLFKFYQILYISTQLFLGTYA